MSVQRFIDENRDAIDEQIRKIDRKARLNDTERILWISKDARVNKWAKSHGLEA